MLTPHEVYISDYTSCFLDLYRFGNSVGPRLDHVRPLKDARIQDHNGVKYIIADGNGVSVFSTFDAKLRNTWRIAKGTPLPAGIKLVIDRRPHHENHFMLAPACTMRLSEFHALLDKIRERATKVT